MRNNNGASIRKLSNRSLRSNRMRNLFAVLAIILTGILFTAVFSLTGGAMQVSQEETMREIGTRSHVGLKAATRQQYEKVIADPLVKESNYNIFIGVAENFVKRQAEVRYQPEERALADMFITLEEGHMPEADEDIIVDTFILDELGLPYELGQKIPLRFAFMGETIEDEFTVCGWYQGDTVAHASELFLSESYWTKLRGAYTDEDFRRWGEEHPEDRGVGLLAVNLNLDKARNLEEKIQTIIRNAGYEPETELGYGVNWAYMGSRLEAVDPFTILILLGAVAVILFTGYLIIYNIFQISVISDIRFYGLLKTIGTTKKQIRRLVRRQALLLSAVGIPVGLLVGYGIGAVALPFMLSFMDYSGMEISLQFQPWILLCSAGFSALTVSISSRKPGKIAGSVSPVEAVKYTQESSLTASHRHRRKPVREEKYRQEEESRTEPHSRRRKPVGEGKYRQEEGRHRANLTKKRRRFSAVSMALSNLGRSRRTTAVVITAISLSIILLVIVMTAVGSFRIDRFIEERIAGDFLLGNISLTGSYRSSDLSIEPDFLELADAQEGIEGRREMWQRYVTWMQLDEEARERLRDLQTEDKLRRDTHSAAGLQKLLAGEESMEGNCFGYSEALFDNVKVLEGTWDPEKFKTGEYVLLTQILGNDFLPPEEHVYKPGDTVTIEWATKDSVIHEITDAGGETIDVVYENLAKKQYQVMAIVDIPSSMGISRYTANGCDMILPLSEFGIEETDGTGIDSYDRYQGENFTNCFTVSYQVREEDRAAFESALKAYTDQNPQMGYLTKEALRKEFEGMVTVIATIGIALAGVIALIGVLNFINAIVTEIISRRREFAMLQSIGMTGAQLLATLIWEGVSYIAISGAISFVLGSILAWLVLRALNGVILFFEYRFQILPFVIVLPVLLFVAALAPAVCYRQFRKKSVVERLREE